MDERPPWLETLRGLAQEILYARPELDQRGMPTMTAWKFSDGVHLRICFHGATEFVLDRAGKRIWATWPEPWTIKDAAVCLRGPILGFATG